MSRNPNITPYLILHYVDQQNETYRGYIVNSHTKRNNNNEIIYGREIDRKFNQGWRVVGTFYALNPLFRPIPSGMNLYCVKHSDSAPMRIFALYKDYDIFDIDNENCTFFITYGQPVVNTVSLYFHDLGINGLFPTFERKPPIGEGKWSDTKFSPIFVMTFASRNEKIMELKNRYDESIRFRCANKKCIPWIDKQPSVYKTKDLLSQESVSISDCVVSCNQNLIDDDLDRDGIGGKMYSPKSILNIIGETNRNQEIGEYVKNMATPLIVAFVVIFLIVVIIFVVFISKKTK